MYNEPIEYDGKACLELALKLLIKAGELCETIIRRMIVEGNYKELHELLEKSRYKERYAEVVSKTAYKPYTFDATNCLSEALLYLADLRIIGHAEIIKTIETASFLGVFKMLDRQIKRYNELYGKKSNA